MGPDPLVGRLINDRYKIVGIIARGGMGKVYRAEQAPLGRLVALKVLNPNYSGDNDPEFHKRFFLEASIASKLTHPNTVTIFDYGKTDDDIYYIAMELLEGRTLHRALREEGPFDSERTAHVARQICRSLREAHGLGVIHRDLKPANIYLVQHGDESDLVKVLDFGLVKNLESEGEELTQAGLFMGSPKYMSPEQIRGERVDSRVDVYALGVIMYEMLTGKVPFDRPNSVNILMAHIQEPVPVMNEFNPSVRVPPVIENIVRKCMEKVADERFASMDEVLAALKQATGLNIGLSGEYRMPPAETPTQDGGYSPSSTSMPIAVAAGEMLSSGTPATMSASITGPVLQVPVKSPPSRSQTFSYVFGAAAMIALVGTIFAWRADRKSANDPVVHAEQIAPQNIVAAAKPAEQGETPNAPAAAASTERAQPQIETVLVSLRSTPQGAMVVVGDREYGPTPTQVEWTGTEASFGREVTFRFQRKGYRDLTVTRQIRGDRLEVEAPPMDPIPVRRPTRDDRPALVAPAAGSKPAVVAPATPPASGAKGYKSEPY
jgi:serine/threonine-protein kinase